MKCGVHLDTGRLGPTRIHFTGRQTTWEDGTETSTLLSSVDTQRRPRDSGVNPDDRVFVLVVLLRFRSTCKTLVCHSNMVGASCLNL